MLEKTGVATEQDLQQVIPSKGKIGQGTCCSYRMFSKDSMQSLPLHPVRRVL